MNRLRPARRFTWKRALLMASIMGLVAAPWPAQQDVSGVWVMTISRGDGTYRRTWYEVKQAGQAVTLTALSDRSPELAAAQPQGAPGRGAPAPITGTFASGKLHFEVAGRGMGRGGATATPPPPTVYEGGYADGKFTLTITGGRGGNPQTAILERSTKEASYPVRLPLPELHVVKNNGLAKTPPMGWNSWNLFASRVDDKLVREIADAMVSSGMKKAGYVYVNIDDTWEGDARDAKGNMTTNQKFPNMKALADYVHSKGLKLGIYSSPGPNTCAGYEGSYGHEEQDAKTFAAWGIDYLKYDWCGASRVYPEDAMRALYQKMGDALLKTGRPIVYSLCQYGRNKVWEWGDLVGGNLWRTTGDIGDRWQSMENIGFGTAIPGPERGAPGLTQLDIAKYSNVGHWNDPDMLEIGNGGMTTDEYKTHFTLWSILRAPLLAGNDIRNMKPEISEILLNTEMIAINQDPAGLEPKLASREGKVDILTRPLKDKSYAVGIFNRGDDEASVKVTWSAIGLKGKLRGRDLWKHQDVDVSGDTYTVKVPKHGVVALRVSAK